VVDVLGVVEDRVAPRKARYGPIEIIASASAPRPPSPASSGTEAIICSHRSMDR